MSSETRKFDVQYLFPKNLARSAQGMAALLSVFLGYLPL